MASSISAFSKPNDTQVSVKKLKDFLGFDFGESYQVMDHVSRNNHPDRPLKVTVVLSEESIVPLKEHLSKVDMEEKVNYSKNRKIKYVTSFRMGDNGYVKRYQAMHAESAEVEYVFFVSSLTIDFIKRTLAYSETGV
jgi:hypothetical protein